MLLVVRLQKYQFHESRMDYQKYQHVRGAMPRVIKFLLLNRTGNRSADWVSLQHLKRWDLIDTNGPDALFRQASRIPVAPQHLLRSLFEPGIQSRRLPVAGAMGLQIDIVQEVPNGACADARNNPISHRLPRQVIARPMRDVQPFGHWLQTRKFYDLSPLHRSDLQISSRVSVPLIHEQAFQTQTLIPLAGPPDRGLITVQFGRKDLAPPACSHPKYNARPTNSEPRQGIAMGNPLQLRLVGTVDDHLVRSTPTHAHLPGLCRETTPPFQSTYLQLQFNFTPPNGGPDGP
jgi:hypothetical protein